MDLDRLVTFVDACRSLNFTETAKSLKISQPTVSKHIRALESELKVALFDRAGGSFVLFMPVRHCFPGLGKLCGSARNFMIWPLRCRTESVGRSALFALLLLGVTFYPFYRLDTAGNFQMFR